MHLSEAIKRHGYRKWYERQLTESHLNLVTAFLALIAAAACLEQMSSPLPLSDKVVDVLGLLVCSAFMAWSIRRYFLSLTFAQAIDARAECPHCRAYGKFAVADDHPRSVHYVNVACKKCGHAWRLKAD
jgi:Zn ribbon nucleic-acid-binding protein